MLGVNKDAKAVALKRRRVIIAMFSKPRECQEGIIRAAANIIDARVRHGVANYLGYERSVEFPAIELAQHHREVRACGVPGDVEVGAELDLRRAMGTAYGDFPAAPGRLSFVFL